MARFFGDLEKGIETFEMLTDGFDTDRSYETLMAHRATLAEVVNDYTEADLHHVPNTGNNPAFVYILRDRD